MITFNEIIGTTEAIDLIGRALDASSVKENKFGMNTLIHAECYLSKMHRILVEQFVEETSDVLEEESVMV